MRVHGYQIITRQPCDYCHQVRSKFSYYVKDGDCTGLFCSQQHFALARDTKQKGKAPNHEENS